MFSTIPIASDHAREREREGERERERERERDCVCNAMYIFYARIPDEGVTLLLSASPQLST